MQLVHALKLFGASQTCAQADSMSDSMGGLQGEQLIRFQGRFLRRTHPLHPAPCGAWVSLDGHHGPLPGGLLTHPLGPECSWRHTHARTHVPAHTPSTSRRQALSKDISSGPGPTANHSITTRPRPGTVVPPSVLHRACPAFHETKVVRPSWPSPPPPQTTGRRRSNGKCSWGCFKGVRSMESLWGGRGSGQGALLHRTPPPPPSLPPSLAGRVQWKAPQKNEAGSRPNAPQLFIDRYEIWDTSRTRGWGQCPSKGLL